MNKSHVSMEQAEAEEQVEFKFAELSESAKDLNRSSRWSTLL